MNIPINPIWDQAMTWVALTEEPCIVALRIDDINYHYVLTKTRMFTHRTFMALISNYKFSMHPSASMTRELTEGERLAPISVMSWPWIRTSAS